MIKENISIYFCLMSELSHLELYTEKKFILGEQLNILR